MRDYRKISHFFSLTNSYDFVSPNVRPLADVRDLNTALVNVVMSPAYWQAVVGRSYSLWMF